MVSFSFRSWQSSETKFTQCQDLNPGSDYLQSPHWLASQVSLEDSDANHPGNLAESSALLLNVHKCWAGCSLELFLSSNVTGCDLWMKWGVGEQYKILMWGACWLLKWLRFIFYDSACKKKPSPEGLNFSLNCCNLEGHFKSFISK